MPYALCLYGTVYIHRYALCPMPYGSMSIHGYAYALFPMLHGTMSIHQVAPRVFIGMVTTLITLTLLTGSATVLPIISYPTWLSRCD